MSLEGWFRLLRRLDFYSLFRVYLLWSTPPSASHPTNPAFTQVNMTIAELKEKNITELSRIARTLKFRAPADFASRI